VQGEHEQALENFSRAYNISRSLNDASMLHLSRVLYGTAHAHQTLNSYAQLINNPSSRISLDRLLDWKDNRDKDFDRPLTPARGSPFSVVCWPVYFTHTPSPSPRNVQADYFPNCPSDLYLLASIWPHLRRDIRLEEGNYMHY